MKSYVVFVERPPKADGKQLYMAMEIGYKQTNEEVELLIANHVNEKRITSLQPGLINFRIVTADTAQNAANQARDKGLVYLSVDDMKRIKADEANAEKFGTRRQADPIGAQGDFDKARAAVDKAFAEIDNAFKGIFGKYRDPFGDSNQPRPRR